ncbi:DnaJ-like protein [Macleaya cordata]|uniref:DnaJ-like protein n=1 Tax=Macleaya cordata TaxID=56857 RepID=A0A200R9P0_MACCD|nr:DnaJ-like protein [Macleaya cordata]
MLESLSETDIINVVEQRIWKSMEEGQFENLPGKGKPLNLATNPHADPAEDTLYRILSQNGFSPEWVELNKEIRSQITEWRSALRKAQANRSNANDSKWIETDQMQMIPNGSKIPRLSRCRWMQSMLRFSGAQLELKPESTTSKPEQKLADRLSAVIDAVNDRKLPPELRGQCNATSLVKYFIMRMFCLMYC